MNKISVAVVGCGNVSSGHIKAWCDEKERAEIVALVDVVKEFAEERKEQYALDSITIHADLNEVLCRDDVDVVDICTPSHLHAEQIAAAMEAGKHVITEKPTGYNPEECRKLRWHAQRCPDVKVAVAYSLRYYPLNVRVRQLVRERAIGRILFAEAAHNHPRDFSHDSDPDTQPRPLRGKKSAIADKGGEYIPSSEMCGPTHVFDLMRYLLGEVRDVFAFREPCGTFALMRFQCGALGKATAATASDRGIATPHVLCIQGTEGSIFTQNEYQYSDKGKVRGYNGYIVTGGQQRRVNVDGTDTSHGDAARTRNFLNAIRDDEPLICSLEDGIRSSELLHAIWDSHNLEIRVPVHQAGKSG